MIGKRCRPSGLTPVVKAVATLWLAVYALPLVITAAGLLWLFFFR